LSSFWRVSSAGTGNSHEEIIAMRSSLAFASLAVLAVALCAAPLSAQNNSQPQIPLGVDSAARVAVDSVNTVDRPTATASLTGLRVAAHRSESRRAARPTMYATRSKNQAQAMMIVGVAGLIAGAIIGGDAGTIVMVGGTVIGLIGLYDYLQ
jgi:hypothetical protein